MSYQNLANAKEAKQDEFYTSLNEIELELKHYRQHFKDKIVFCNCDDPYESNFFKYFAINFNFLGLKKLIATCYDGSPAANTQLSLFDYLDGYKKNTPEKTAHKIEINEVNDYNNDGAIDLSDVEYLLKNDKNSLKKLKGNGDFRSKESIQLLQEADIVVTNPPFSLFKEYVAQLIKYKKKFLIIGNMNALHYKEIFPLVKNNEIWTGFGFNKTMDFIMPNSYKMKGKAYIDNDGKKHGFVPAICWFTNLDIQKRHETMTLYKSYQGNENHYPHYENLDGIDVSVLSEIPNDYDGLMGVPDTFLEKYNPEQFEILGLSCGDLAKQIGITKNYRGRTDLAYIDENGNHKCPYSRIVIRKRKK